MFCRSKHSLMYIGMRFLTSCLLMGACRILSQSPIDQQEADGGIRFEVGQAVRKGETLNNFVGVFLLWRIGRIAR